MPFGITYTPSQTIRGPGDAAEQKSETWRHSSGGSSSSSSAGWNPWQKQLASPWTRLGRTNIGQIQRAYGAGVPDLMQVAQNVMNWSAAPPPEYTAGWQALVNSFQPTATEDFYQNAVRAPALREWQQETLPALREAYGDGGYYSADRQREEAQLARDLALHLAKTKSDLEYQSAEAAKARELQGAPVAMNYASFVPQLQIGTLSALFGNVNPMLQALTNYMSRQLQSSQRSSSSESSVSHSASHGVSGYRPYTPPAPAKPAPVIDPFRGTYNPNGSGRVNVGNAWKDFGR